MNSTVRFNTIPNCNNGIIANRTLAPIPLGLKDVTMNLWWWLFGVVVGMVDVYDDDEYTAAC